MNTQENNKLIAEFMGKEFITNNIFIHRLPKDFLNNSENYKCFHNSWDWLMEVVQKIEDLGNDVAITSNYVQIAYNEGEGFISIELKGRIMLEAVYSACIDFINWYNNQNK